MNNRTLAVSIIAAVGLVTAISQIMLKISANKTHKNRLGEYFNLWVIGSYGLLFLTTLLNMWAMQYLSFKLVSMLSCVSYIFVVILGKLCLKETISARKWLGMVLICLGILVFNLS